MVGFPGDPHGSELAAWASWVSQSSWLTAVGADYAVQGATVSPAVVLPDAAPSEISDAEIQSLLLDRIGDGTLPMPGGQTVYVLSLPASTLVFFGSETSCTSFGGYHASVSQGALHVAYAVLPTCPAGQFGPTEIAGLEVVASHELIEAATDPFVGDDPAFTIDTSQPSSGAWPWLGSEVADLCAHQPIVFPSGTGMEWAQRVWSTSAAASGGDPCVPNPAAQPYFNASVVGDAVRDVAPGDTVVFELTGFSLEDVPPWTIDAQPKTREFDVSLELDSPTLQNGQTVHLTVQVPSTASAGSTSGFVLRSLRNGDTDNYAMWPMAVVIPN